MSKQLAVVIKSQADGNQLATLVHSHKVRSIDSGAVRPFKVGETAIFWLYPEQVKFILDNYIPHSPAFGLGALGKRFGCDKSTVHAVVKRLNWNHLES